MQSLTRAEVLCCEKRLWVVVQLGWLRHTMSYCTYHGNQKVSCHAQHVTACGISDSGEGDNLRAAAIVHWPGTLALLNPVRANRMKSAVEISQFDSCILVSPLSEYGLNDV